MPFSGRQKRTTGFRRNALKSFRRQDCIGVLILGACKVGKTSLMRRWRHGEYTDVYSPTVEEFYVHSCKSQGKTVRLGLIDITGSGDFPGMLELYIERTDCIMLVYEIGNIESFKEIERLHQLVLDVRGDDQISFSVVATKKDQCEDMLETQIREDIDDFLCKLRYPKFITTSSKLDVNVSAAFENAISGTVSHMVPGARAIVSEENKKKRKIYCLCCR